VRLPECDHQEMRNLTRLAIVFAVVALSAVAVRHFHRPFGLNGPRQDDDGVPVRAWADVASEQESQASPYAKAEGIGKVTDKKLSEISGITYSKLRPGTWWIHNDSGDSARIAAIDSKGNLIAAFRVVGAVNEDWEDIATGPGSDGSPALYIADIGDNGLKRDFVVVYRVKEPDLSQGEREGDTQPVEPFQFVYPDGRNDAEALIVDPGSGRIFIVTKSRSEPCKVYGSPLPLRLGVPMTLERMQGLAMSKISSLRLVTGSAASPDGSRAIIRTYFTAFELARSAGKGFESIFDSTPVQVPLPLEPQGEAISYSNDGRSVVTISEQLPAVLNRMTRK
jgi:hypothetical protein